MDNNNYTRRPRKRITKEIARRRQLTALFVIAFIVLMIVVLIAKGCSKGSNKKSGGSSNNNANIATTAATEPYVAPPEVTFPESDITEEATTKSAGGEFKMKKYTYSITVGETITAWIDDNGYPAGVTEADEQWSSSDDKIAMVDAYGHVTGISKGECYVTVSAANDPSIESQVKIIVN